MSYEIEKIDLCKYVKKKSLKLPIECSYINIIQVRNENPIITYNCPKDSGTDGKCNGECAKVYTEEVE